MYAPLSLRSGLCTPSPSVLNSFAHFLLLADFSAFWSHQTSSFSRKPSCILLWALMAPRAPLPHLQ